MAHQKTISRRSFMGAAAAAALAGSHASTSLSSPSRGQQMPAPGESFLFTNGRIHTMDPANRIVAQLLIRNGRVVAAGDDLASQSAGARPVDLAGKTAIPGIIDAHNHIVLVGNRPGWHALLEHVFTIPDVIGALKARSASVPAGEFISTVGPISAMQFAERRLPNLAELDAIDRPVYLQGCQGGTRTNSLGKAWFEARGITVSLEGALPANAALLALRRELLTPESRRRTALGALQYYASLGITTHKDSGAFHSDEPAGGIASENTYTMHDPFRTLDREGSLPVRVRLDFLHQDPANANPPLPTLSPRLKNSFPFFGNDWLKTGGIGEFTGGGIEGLRAIARAGWRAEDHALNLAGAQNLVAAREMVNAEIPIKDLRWIISHIPNFNVDLANRMHALGMGVLVGWGPLRTGAKLGPPHRMLFDHPIPMGYHSDGGDITVINPWLNFYTMITGRNLAGQQVLAETLTRQETLWLATAANKWFIWEDDIGSLEPGNQGDLVVLDRDFFAVPEEELIRIRSLLTMVGGKVAHNEGVL